MSDILFSVMAIAAAVLTGLIIYIILSLIISRWDKLAFSRKLKIKLSHLKKPLFSLIPASCVLLSPPFLRLTENARPVVSHIAYIWLIGSLGWLAIKAVYMFREFILSRYDIGVSDNLAARRVYTQIGVITNIISVAIIILTVSIMLMTFGKVRQIGVSILASAGIIGIVLGLAAQKTLGNVIAGIQIAVAQPIRLDDAVVVENEWGWIEEITLTYVVVRIWDLRRLVLPISYFVEKPFQNWTRTSAALLGSVFIYTDYTVPVDEVRKELTRILQQSPHWDKEVNVLQVTNTTERTVEMRALMSAANSPTAWNLRCEVREKLLEILQKKFPQSLPRLRVEIQKD